MLKLLFLLHRWLGIGLGLVMLLWCLSGFVMMYKAYPELNEQEQLATLAPLDLSACCNLLPEFVGAADEFTAFGLQMLGASPLLTLSTVHGDDIRIDLSSGTPLDYVDKAAAETLAAAFSARAGLPDFALLATIDNDQWTVYGAYNPLRPLYKFGADDAAATQWYISARSGEVIQVTTRDQRLWGYLGAVTHWLYPTLLREQVQLWSQTVIWLTILGIFLTLTGLYFGLRQYKTRKNGRKSPYRGLSAWHHYSGLLFGVLTLSWVFSGLFSMNPWGLLEGDGSGAEQQLLRGGNLALAEIAPVLGRMPALDVPADVVRLEGEKLLGKLRLYTVTSTGVRTRLRADTLSLDNPDTQLLSQLATLLAPAGAPVSAELLTEEDNYYYHHHEKVRLPAWRVLGGQHGETRYYLDPVTGALLSKIDPEKRWYRWVFYGLHRGDFTRTIRSRPLWDILMWTLLLGVTATCTTGFCMGVRRLTRRSPARRSAIAIPARDYRIGEQNS